MRFSNILVSAVVVVVSGRSLAVNAQVTTTTTIDQSATTTNSVTATGTTDQAQTTNTPHMNSLVSIAAMYSASSQNCTEAPQIVTSVLFNTTAAPSQATPKTCQPSTTSSTLKVSTAISFSGENSNSQIAAFFGSTPFLSAQYYPDSSCSSSSAQVVQTIAFPAGYCAPIGNNIFYQFSLQGNTISGGQFSDSNCKTLTGVFAASSFNCATLSGSIQTTGMSFASTKTVLYSNGNIVNNIIYSSSNSASKRMNCPAGFGTAGALLLSSIAAVFIL